MEPKKKRFGRNTVRALAWAAGAAAFAVPWAAFHFAPVPTVGAQGTSAQVVVVPAGSRIVVVSAPQGASGVRVIGTKAATAASPSAKKAAPIITTGASVPPP